MATSWNSTGGYNPTFSTRNVHSESSPSGVGSGKDTSSETALSDVTGGYNPTFSTRGGNTDTSASQVETTPANDTTSETALSDVTGGYNPTFSTRGGNTDTSASQVETAPASDTSSETALSDVTGGYNPTFSTRGGNTDMSTSQVETTPANDTSSETALSDVTGGYNPTFSTRGGNTDTSASQVETTPANDTSSDTALSDVTGGYNPTFSTRGGNTDTFASQVETTPANDTSSETALSDVTGGYNPTFSTRGGNTDMSTSQVETTPANDTSSETALSDVTGGYNPTFSTRGGNTDTSASQVETTPTNGTTTKTSDTLTLDTSDTLKTLLTTLGEALNTIITQATTTRPTATNEKFQTLQDTLLSSTTSIATKATESLKAFNKVLDSLIQLNEETAEKINTLETTTPHNTQTPENTVRVNIKPASATSLSNQHNATDDSNPAPSENETHQAPEPLNDSPTNTSEDAGATTLSSAEQSDPPTQPDTSNVANQLSPDSPVAPEGPTKPIDKTLYITSHSPAQTTLSAAMDDIRATYPSVPINNTIQAEIAAELMGQNTNPGSQQPADTIHLTDQQIRILSDAIAHNINVRRQMAAQQMLADANLDGFGYSGADFELGSVSSDFQQAVLEICDQVIQAGIPYAWGGGSLEGPSQGISDNGNYADACGDYAKIGFDCSGFSRYVFYQATGVEIPRTAAPQCDYSILIDEPMIGDLGFPTNYSPGHVVVYVGNGEIAEAQQSGTNLMYSAASPTYVWKRPPESPNWDY